MFFYLIFNLKQKILKQQGETAIHVASCHGFPEIVRIFCITLYGFDCVKHLAKAYTD
jgi:hypothetical protein